MPKFLGCHIWWYVHHISRFPTFYLFQGCEIMSICFFFLSGLDILDMVWISTVVYGDKKQPCNNHDRWSREGHGSEGGHVMLRGFVETISSGFMLNPMTDPCVCHIWQHLPSICPKCGSYGNWEWLNVTNRAFIMKPWAMGIEYRMGVHQLYQTLELQSGLYSQFPQFPYPNDSISWTISMLMVLKFQSHSTLAESMLLGRMVTRILTHGSWMWPEISE